MHGGPGQGEAEKGERGGHTAEERGGHPGDECEGQGEGRDADDGQVEAAARTRDKVRRQETPGGVDRHLESAHGAGHGGAAAEALENEEGQGGQRDGDGKIQQERGGVHAVVGF